MKLKALFTALAAAIAMNASNSAQAVDLTGLGITVPQAGAKLMCDEAPNDPAFKAFNCPLMMEAMWWADPAILKGTSRAQQFVYISSFIKGVHDASIVWKVDSSVYSQLDPRLPMHIAYVASTNQDILGAAIGENAGILFGGLMAFVEARKQSVRNGTVNPLGEIGAWMSGSANAAKPIMLTTKIAEHDVMGWIALAQRDPDAAIQLYQGIRTIALNF